MTDATSDTVPLRNYAAMLSAVGWLRGSLYGVLSGEIDRAEIQRLLDATSTAAIAKLLGQTEADLAIDADLYLTRAEQRAIGGQHASAE